MIRILMLAALISAPSASAAKPAPKPATNLAYQHYSRGVELAGKKKWAEALEKFQAAIDLNPTYVDSYIEWGRASVMAGRRREGLEKLSAALAVARDGKDKERLTKERDSLSDIFYTNETFQQYQNGLNYLRLERSGSAVEALDKALKTEPDNVAVLLAYAHALQIEERRKEALAALERAFLLNEGNREVRMNLAEALLAQNPERASQLLKPLLDPLEERVAWLQAQALSSLKRNREAIEFLRVNTEKNQQWVYAPFWLGKLYALEVGGGWNARKYLMTFLRRSMPKGTPESPEAQTPEARKLRAARAEAEALLTQVNRSLE